MTPEDFINQAIEAGQTAGIEALDENQRMVWLISEAEVDCDMNGIESFLDRYAPRRLQDTSTAFRAIGATEIAECFELVTTAPRDETFFDRLNGLITSRAGYNYEAIAKEVARRLAIGISKQDQTL